MFLGKKEIIERLKNDRLIEAPADLDIHITPNGYDLHVAALIEITESGKLAVDKAENTPPKLGAAFVLIGHEDCIKDLEVTKVNVLPKTFPVEIQAGVPYFLITAEKVNMPNDYIGIMEARTSLHRFTQAQLIATFIEAGYKGTLTLMLIPSLETELELGSRIAQISFAKLTSTASYDEQKETSWQGGKIL